MGQRIVLFEEYFAGKDPIAVGLLVLGDAPNMVPLTDPSFLFILTISSLTTSISISSVAGSTNGRNYYSK